MPELRAVAEVAPPDCAVCRRSLLVGESLGVFRDRDGNQRNVCELCRDQARQRGLEPVHPVDAPRLRVRPSGAVADVAERDALLEGLGAELDYLREQLGAAQHAMSERTLREEAVEAITDKLRRQERELQRLRREHDPARRAEEQRTLKSQAMEIRQLREELATRDAVIQQLQTARVAEIDPRRMCGFALEAFNASEHADRMARIARTLDEPEVSLRDQGPAIPRRVVVTLAWDIAWYQFEVKVDLGAGRASVHQVGNGGDPRAIAAEVRTASARWSESGLVLS